MVSSFCEPLGVRTQDFSKSRILNHKALQSTFSNSCHSELWRYCGICHANKLIYHPALLALLTGNYVK